MGAVCAQVSLPYSAWSRLCGRHGSLADDRHIVQPDAAEESDSSDDSDSDSDSDSDESEDDKVADQKSAGTSSMIICIDPQRWTEDSDG